MSKSPGFVICVDNDDYQVSLQKGKLYEVVENKRVDNGDLIRVRDETGEEYLFPSECFLPIDVPEKVQKALKT